jgi:hypothetical protein
MQGECPFYNCVSRRGNANLRKERKREVTARLGGRASVRSHGTERSKGNNRRREGHARGWKFCPYAGVGVVSWTGRVLAVATRRAWACQRIVPTQRGARELEARREFGR